jgi:phage tail-like protein
MPPLDTQAKLGMAMRFEVTIDDMPLGGWSKCEGLAVEFTYLDWAEGGTNSHTPLLPDRVKYSEIKLSRALTAQESLQVMSWLSKKAKEFAPGTGVIKLYDAYWSPRAPTPAPPVATWTLRNVCPKQWSGPQLDAHGTSVATETLVLVHEGFLDE